MSLVIVLLSLVVLIILISYFKIDTFLSFLIVSIGAGLALGIAPDRLPQTMESGIGSILGSLSLLLVLGAMLGKIIAESGAAREIASVMVSKFGVKHIQWGMAFTGLLAGIPLFYGIGFVLLVPLLFSVINQYKLPAVYTGLPMLAALSVTHGFLPPHPSPTALVAMFNANIGNTLVYGLLLSVPAIISAGPVFSRSLKNMVASPIALFETKEPDKKKIYLPGKLNSLFSATLSIILLLVVALISYFIPADGGKAGSFLKLFGSPAVVMLIALTFATYSLGIRQGRKMKEVMKIYVDAIKDIAPVLLIIAGSGMFKQVMDESGISGELAAKMQQLPIHPLVLGWLTAAFIRICVGSATVAALTTAGVMTPLVIQSGVNPNLMVLSLGAGSLFLSHVNDAGFWMFKEYFGLSMKDTFRSWTVMETIVSLTGLGGVLVLNFFI
ncbi:MAG: gluconate:H+ symporter [Dysgonamonadaceae bacterium]|jgi:Gnt-I system high-affinity gluconate transporter|nr:gluconate:H+ symporter [Dysgonamonadaceae bacterium]